MLPRIYIETSVISYLTSRPSRDVVALARQQRTREFWQQFGVSCTPLISPLVIEEISQGVKQAPLRRIEACQPIEVVAVDESAESLAQTLMARGAIPTT
jgi:hypothetical protein